MMVVAEQDVALQPLKQLMQLLSERLPKLPAQHDALLGNALLNLALMRLIVAHGQEGTANLLAASAEALWSAACEQTTVTIPATVLNA